MQFAEGIVHSLIGVGANASGRVQEEEYVLSSIGIEVTGRACHTAKASAVLMHVEGLRAGTGLWYGRISFLGTRRGRKLSRSLFFLLEQKKVTLLL